MTFLARAAESLGLAYRAEATTGDTSAAVLPPPRAGAGAVSVEESLALDAVFRAFMVFQTAVEQLTMDTWDGARKLEGLDVPVLVRRPDPDAHLADFLGETVTSLAGQGNAYLRIHRWSDGQPIATKGLPPLECHPYRDRHGVRKVAYGTGPDLVVGRDVAHLRLLKISGRDLGLGPIQAAQARLRGQLDVADYASGWFDTTTTPDGVLTTDQPLTDAEAKAAQERWVARQAGRYGTGPAVMGRGLTYSPLHLTPAEVQWLENQKFGITQVARLFGMTSRQLLAAIDGTSDTYSNHEQDEISWVRYTLMRYLREIEITFEQLLPRTKTVRFNVDALLRTDTKTRYQAHEIGIRAKFLHPDEVRAIEGLAPLTDTQREQLAAMSTPVAAADPEAATEDTTTDQEQNA